MIGKSAAVIFNSLLDMKRGSENPGRMTLREIVHQVGSYPIKALAAFFTAPVLIVKIALQVKNPVRRAFAVAGIVLSLILAYLAATFLGTLVGALFVASSFGILAGIGFLVGTSLSVVLSVTFSYLIFTATSFTFLHLSSQEVADYLNEIST